MRTPSRRKSCRRCSSAKVRCDLQRPTCGTCQARSLACEYATSNDAPISSGILQSRRRPRAERIDRRDTSDQLNLGNEWLQESTSPSALSNDDGSTVSNRPSAPDSLTQTPDTEFQESLTAANRHPLEAIPSEFVVSEERRRVLLGASPCTFGSGIVARHTSHFVIRVLKTWPRMMTKSHAINLPPVIHMIQFKDCMPTPLANCYTLVKMWAGHPAGSSELVQRTILTEIRRLVREVR